MPSIYKPPRRGTRIACGVIGCLAVVLIFGGGGIGGCVYYTRFYLPDKARNYIGATEESFKSVASVVEKLKAGMERSGTAQPSVEQREREIDAACELTRQLVKKTERARKRIPADSSIAEGLEKSLVEYYDLTGELGSSYGADARLHQKTLPLLRKINDASEQLAEIKVNNVADAKEAFKLCRQMETEFQDYRQEFEKMEANDDTAESKDQVLTLIDGMVAFLHDTGDAIYLLRAGPRKWSDGLMNKSQRISKGAQKKFNKVLKDFESRSGESEAKLKGKLRERIKDIVDKQEVVENYLKSLKSDYGI